VAFETNSLVCFIYSFPLFSLLFGVLHTKMEMPVSAARHKFHFSI